MNSSKQNFNIDINNSGEFFGEKHPPNPLSNNDITLKFKLSNYL